MTAPVRYLAATALHEATGLAATTVFATFSASLGRYVATGAGEGEMVAGGRAAATEMRSLGMPPERFLCALRIANTAVPRTAPMSATDRHSDARVTRAIDLFLQQYFLA